MKPMKPMKPMKALWNKKTECYVADLRADGSRPIFSLDGNDWTDSMGEAPDDAEFHEKTITLVDGPRDGTVVAGAI